MLALYLEEHTQTMYKYTIKALVLIGALILISSCAPRRTHVGYTPESRKSERLSIKATAQFNPH